jgi:hypothetical protein
MWLYQSQQQEEARADELVGQLGELGGPAQPELGHHLVEVFWLAKAEVGLVDPTIAEIKVTERKVDRIMREYEDFVFTAEDRALYQLRIAMLVVSPSTAERETLSELSRRGTSLMLGNAVNFFRGEGWKAPTLWDVCVGRIRLAHYVHSRSFKPARK